MLLSSLTVFMGGNWWFQIPSQDQLLFAVISFIINLLIMTIVFYLAGVIVVGKRRALFSDALVISLLGTVVLIVCLSVFGLEIGIILSLIAWLLLVRHYYETGWLGAIAVGIMSIIVAVVIVFILSILLGISILLFRWLPLFLVF